MSKFSKIKIPLLLVVGVAVAAVAILAGAGLVGGSSSASDRGGGGRLAGAAGCSSGNRGRPHDRVDRFRDDRHRFHPGLGRDVHRLGRGRPGLQPGHERLAAASGAAKTANYCKRSAAWTGDEMLVWGCGLTAYNPSTNQWRRLPDSPTRNGIVVWTGRELIGWGGGCCGDVPTTARPTTR